MCLVQKVNKKKVTMAPEKAPAVLLAKAPKVSPPAMEPKIAPAEALAPTSDVIAPFLANCKQTPKVNLTDASDMNHFQQMHFEQQQYFDRRDGLFRHFDIITLFLS
jgi:hypothetical protein